MSPHRAADAQQEPGHKPAAAPQREPPTPAEPGPPPTETLPPIVRQELRRCIVHWVPKTVPRSTGETPQIPRKSPKEPPEKPGEAQRDPKEKLREPHEAPNTPQRTPEEYVCMAIIMTSERQSCRESTSPFNTRSVLSRSAELHLNCFDLFTLLGCRPSST